MIYDFTTQMLDQVQIVCRLAATAGYLGRLTFNELIEVLSGVVGGWNKKSYHHVWCGRQLCRFCSAAEKERPNLNSHRHPSLFNAQRHLAAAESTGPSSIYPGQPCRAEESASSFFDENECNQRCAQGMKGMTILTLSAVLIKLFAAMNIYAPFARLSRALDFELSPAANKAQTRVLFSHREIHLMRRVFSKQMPQKQGPLSSLPTLTDHRG